jgi:hypothetical protein
MADKTLQFGFGKAPPPPPPPHLPGWLLNFGHWLAGLLRGVGSVVGFVGNQMVWVFVAGLAIILGLVLFFIGREIARTRWPERRKPKAVGAEPEWRPEASAARALLDEADRLAAAGEYAEAAHLILYRSIEDIEKHRPRLVRPAFTSREIGELGGIPDGARSTFATITWIVEHSFFGGRDVDAAGYAECRKAYESFAFPEAWA